MPNYQALKAAVADTQFAGQTDDEIASALNAPITVMVDTPISAMLGVLLTSGEWPAVVLRSEIRPADDVVKAAIAATALAAQAAGGGLTSVKTSTLQGAAALDASLGALQMVGDVSAQSVSAIQSIRNESTTRAAQMGFAEITTDDIAASRKV